MGNNLRLPSIKTNSYGVNQNIPLWQHATQVSVFWDHFGPSWQWQEGIDASYQSQYFLAIRKNNTRMIKECISIPAANAAADLISSCSAEKWSTTLLKISPCGDISLRISKKINSFEKWWNRTYMKRPSSPTIKRLRITIEGLALEDFWQEKNEFMFTIKQELVPSDF